MVARHGLRRWALAALTALVACVEQARSADVVGSASADAPVTAQAYTVEQLTPRAPTVDVGEVEVRVHSTPPVLEVSSFFGERSDAELRRALAGSGIMKVEKGRGGRSLGFRLLLDSGEKAYFKADQTFSAANWFGEVASYHLDRMIGLGRVPLVVSRTFPWATLAPAAGKDVRTSEIITRNGEVQGALVAWVTGHLMPLPHQPGWERWIRVQGWPANTVSPFQRPAVWKQQLMTRHLAKAEQQRRRGLRPEPDREDRAAELSDLVVFDYLTRNQDRWGGENANVLVRGARGPLVFLDNGASFEPGDPRPGLMEARLHALQRFRRKTIAGIRAFDLQRFKARLAQEQVQPVLTEAQLAGLVQRREALLEWVAQQEAAHGEAIWAWE